MKKRLFFLFLILLALLSGCGETTAPATEPATTQPETAPVSLTEPETTLPPTEADPISLLGVDLTGLSREDAYQLMCDTVSCYQLTLSVNGDDLTFCAQDLHLEVSQEAFDRWFTEQDDTAGILTFQCDQAVYTAERRFAQSARNAGISYSSKAGQFVSTAERAGKKVSHSDVRSAITDAVSQLLPTASATVSLSTVQPAIRSTDTRIPAAIDQANRYLDISLSLIFEAPGVTKATETLSKSTLASFVDIDSNFAVSLDTGAIRDYAESMGNQHGGRRTKGQFVTTHGTTVNRTVEYYGATVDEQTLYDELLRSLEQLRSGSINVLYQSAETSALPYGGNYVEIDLSSQTLWVYKNSQRVVTTPLVSGNVNSGHWTGGGVFSIYDLDTDCWLVGSTWRQYVYYWIGFNGSIGVHDAPWRDVFGGSIYQYNGSHGCVNVPLDAARQVYNNVSLGTKVIVYGGKSYVGPMTQSFTGVSSHRLTTQSAPFYLNVTPAYRATEITYASSDTGVVTVDNRGMVTVVGPGTATVTVVSEAIGPLSRAEFPVSITVESPEMPTEPPTEAPTEPPTEAPTEVPTEPTTEVPTEPTTEVPTEAPTEPVTTTEPATEESTTDT